MNVDTQTIRRMRDTLTGWSSLSDLDHTGAADSGARGEHWVQVVMDRVAPFAEAMYLVMMADGDEGPEERRAMLGALRILTDGEVAEAAIAGLLDTFRGDAADFGSEARLQNVSARLPDREDRETAFTLAAVVALADDRVEVSENRMLEAVREHLGVSAKRCSQILDSMD